MERKQPKCRGRRRKSEKLTGKKANIMVSSKEESTGASSRNDATDLGYIDMMDRDPGMRTGASADHTPRAEERVFPDWSMAAVHVLTLVVRVCIVCDRRNWWILHPDEVYQSVEGMLK